MWTTILVSGISLGSFYVLITLGFALIFGVTRNFNLAHGELLVLAGYSSYWLWKAWAFPFVLTFPFATRADLVAHWPLNEGSGEVFRDLAGGNDGFLPVATAPAWTEDAAPTTFANPYALEFTGSGFVDTLYEGIEGRAAPGSLR